MLRASPASPMPFECHVTSEGGAAQRDMQGRVTLFAALDSLEWLVAFPTIRHDVNRSIASRCVASYRAGPSLYTAFLRPASFFFFFFSHFESPRNLKSTVFIVFFFHFTHARLRKHKDTKLSPPVARKSHPYRRLLFVVESAARRVCVHVLMVVALCYGTL